MANPDGPRLRATSSHTPWVPGEGLASGHRALEPRGETRKTRLRRRSRPTALIATQSACQPLPGQFSSGEQCLGDPLNAGSVPAHKHARHPTQASRPLLPVERIKHHVRV